MNSAYPQNQNGWNQMGSQAVQTPQNMEQNLNIDIVAVIQGGMNTVNSCMVPNGRTAALFDRDEAYFYLKQVNQNGQVIMLKRFRYEEDEPVSEYIPREEFNKRFDELRDMIASITAPKAPQASQSAFSKEGE